MMKIDVSSETGDKTLGLKGAALAKKQQQIAQGKALRNTKQLRM